MLFCILFSAVWFVMYFLDVLSAVANILTALSVTAHFLHALVKCRRTTSESGMGACMAPESEGTPRTDEVERGSGLHGKG